MEQDFEFGLVSIITPSYNCEKYIKETINSVLNQSYKNWELLIIDDCSRDNTFNIAKSYANTDPRIKVFSTGTPSGGPALPRNLGIEMALGRYISFLDADDIWGSDKIKNQISLFNNSAVAIVYGNYEKVSESGVSNDRFVLAPRETNYKKLLKGNIIACSTAMFDTYRVGKRKFVYCGHEDYILWLEILKQDFIAINTNSCDVRYRIRENSISSNKLRVIGWIWHIYRNIEKQSIFKSLYLCSITLTKSFFKYLK